LVVDDDADIRAALVVVLEAEGHVVAQAENGEEAFRYLRGERGEQGRPRLIILDLSMPVMDGWRFHEQKQADASLAGIPVVVISARRHGDAPVPVDADRFLPKPVKTKELLEVVRWFCR